jgi:hypothetical protein
VSTTRNLLDATWLFTNITRTQAIVGKITEALCKQRLSSAATANIILRVLFNYSSTVWVCFAIKPLIVLCGWVVLEGGDYAKRFEVLGAQVKPGVFKPEPEWTTGELGVYSGTDFRKDEKA